MKYYKMPKKKPSVFCFFPLASIGGTESVHLDVLKALSDYPIEIFIRYRSNVWKGKEYAKTKDARIEGIQLLPEFRRYGKVLFSSKYLEAPRLGRLIRVGFVKYLAWKINRHPNPIVIFWHRESLDFLWPLLEEHVRIIDIVHNNSNNKEADAVYLNNDWATRLNRRVLVSEGLRHWIKTLYQPFDNSNEMMTYLKVIPHAVTIPPSMAVKSSKCLRVLFIGRDSMEKRFPLFLQIAASVQGLNADVAFHVVGPVQSDYTEALGNLTWHGTLTERSEIEKIYREMHCVLLTSSSEGFPKVISEAMAFGCVPIVTAVGGIPLVLTHEENAILTDVERCVEESIQWIFNLSKDTKRFSELSEKSYIYAQENFNPSRFENEWKSLVESLG